MARLAFIFAFLFSASAFAADYRPGTVGHLYADCRAALEGSTKLTELQETYCGSFTEGYVWGVLASNWTTPPIEDSDPCKADKTREYERINTRFCQSFPLLDPKSATTGDVLNAATDIVTRWIEFEKNNSKSDPLKRGTLRVVNDIVKPGPFCDALATSYPTQEPPFVINPALVKTNLKDFFEARKGMTIAAKYERCKKDVETAGGDSKKFLSTKCGAEISGYISGVHATQHLQKNRTESTPECTKQIDRIYKNLDVTKTMCVSYDTNPLWVAEIFLTKYPEIKNPENLPGGIGNLIMFKGFLCAENRKGG